MVRSSALRLWSVLSFLATIAAFLSLVENWHLIEWKGVFAAITEFYRRLMNPLFEVAYTVWQDHPLVRLFRVAKWPIWLRDLWIISLFGSAPAAIALVSSVSNRQEVEPEESLYFRLITTAILGGTLLGIPLLLIGAVFLLWPANWLRVIRFVASSGEDRAKSLGSIAHWLTVLLVYTVVILVFFFLNEFTYN